MKTIWKFYAEIGVGFVRRIPRGYDVIHVGKDPSGSLCFWAEVEPEAAMEEVLFIVVGTGHVVPYATMHLGSCLDGEFMRHLYGPKRAS